jgi:hypothetical protein
MSKLTIKQVCERENLSPVYVRRSLLKGKLVGEKELIATNTERWLIDEAEVDRWRATRANSGARKDGRNKFNLYATPRELKALKALLKANDLDVPLKRANQPKS